MSAPYAAPIIAEATSQHQALEIMNLKKELDDRMSGGMAFTLKATIRDLSEQLAAMTKERDELMSLWFDDADPLETKYINQYTLHRRNYDTT